MDQVKRICDFIAMNSKQRIHFHKFRMQMANSLLRIVTNLYEFIHINLFLFAKLQTYSYEFVRVSSMSVYKWPVL